MSVCQQGQNLIQKNSMDKKNRLNRLLWRVNPIRVKNELNELRKYRTWVPPGHYYSPIPSIEGIKKREKDVFDRDCSELAGIELNETQQLSLLEKFSEYHEDIPFTAQKDNKNRFYFDNLFYSYADGVVLYSMIKYLQPKRIIEIGSGFSSALMLDMNEMYFEKTIKCTFIEPYPERLQQLVGKADSKNIDLRVNTLQETPLSLFNELKENDILFVDSSHVSKAGSDVNKLLFEVLPNLNSGVYIHIHDIFFPFEYPKGWIYKGVAWNEAYALRAFLQYNQNYEIFFFTSFLLVCHRDKIKQYLPKALESEVPNPTLADTPGASIWLKKVSDH